MDNNELLNEFKKHTEMLSTRTEKEFERHMGILLAQHEKEIKTVGEGHSTLLGKLDEFKSEFHEHKNITEKRLDRIEGKVDVVIKDHEKRIRKVEEKVGV